MHSYKTQKSKKVLSLVDFCTIFGFILAAFFSTPKILIVSSIVVGFYSLYRLFSQSNITTKITFLLLALVSLYFGVKTYMDQQSLYRLDCTIADKQFYSSYDLINSDFDVYAIRKNGKKLSISDFDISPTILKTGNNIITITYKGLEQSVNINAREPKIEELQVSCVNKDFYVGDLLTSKNFNVIGIDSLGKQKKLITLSFLLMNF